jgi:hypothetical protein
MVAVGDKATAAWANNLAGLGYVGDSIAGAAITLSTTSAFASSCSVTFTLTSTRRIRIDTVGAFILNTAGNGHCGFRAAYNSGAAPVIGSAVTPGQQAVVTTTITGGPGAVTGTSFCTALLTAGTYTAYVSCTRTGGGATDQATAFGVLVTDIGSV